MDAIQITEDLAASISKLLNETHRRAQLAKDKEADAYRLKLDELDAKENGLLDLRLAETPLDDETFHRQLSRIRAERKRNFDLLQDAQRRIDGAYLVVADKVLNLAKNAKSLWMSRSREERRDFLAKLLLNPVLEGATVRYDLKEPFAVLSEMREDGKWRTRQDSNLRPSDS